MRKRKSDFIKGFLLLAFFGTLLSCATDTAPLQVAGSLPQSELAYYCDAFDSFREDIWEKAGFVFSAAQMGNIKIASMTIEDGRMRIDTKTGGFSKGGLVSRFSLRGDFDIQIDFQIDFVKGEIDMDQSLAFGALERANTMKRSRLLMIGLLKIGKRNQGGIVAGYLQGGKYHSGYWHPVNNFYGTLRFVRIGGDVSTFYRNRGQTRWTRMCTLPSSQKETIFGIVLQNFVKERNSIKATRSITGWIDNFTVNAAQQIIESEI
jgi:hypothetical protein